MKNISNDPVNSTQFSNIITNFEEQSIQIRLRTLKYKVFELNNELWSTNCSNSATNFEEQRFQTNLRSPTLRQRIWNPRCYLSSLWTVNKCEKKNHDPQAITSRVCFCHNPKTAYPGKPNAIWHRIWTGSDIHRRYSQFVRHNSWWTYAELGLWLGRGRESSWVVS